MAANLNIQSNPQGSAVTSLITDEDYIAFIGKNANKYLTNFKEFSAEGFDEFSATWHWPAFFMPSFWMLYRKLYLWSLLAFFLQTTIPLLIGAYKFDIYKYYSMFGYSKLRLMLDRIPDSFFWLTLIIPYIVFGIIGNYIYYKKAKKKLLELSKIPQSSNIERATKIAHTGGVNNVAFVIAMVLIATAGSIAMVMVVDVAIISPIISRDSEKAKKEYIKGKAFDAEKEIKYWLHSALKNGDDVNLREVDSNGDGHIDSNDMTNSDLRSYGVCAAYVEYANAKRPTDFFESPKSPWNLTINLWTTSEGRAYGQITCIQSGDNITLTAFDNEGTAIYSKVITPEL